MTNSVKCHGENENGSRVFSSMLSVNDVEILQKAHSLWMTCKDSLITESKDIVCRSFEMSDGVDDIRGMACGDFLYMFNVNRKRHYFACVKGMQSGRVLCYECEADMGFSSEASFDTVMLMVQDGFGQMVSFDDNQV